MKKIIFKFGIFVLSVLYGIMKLFPQDKKRVVFISREFNTPSVDFLLIEKELKKDFEGCRTVMLCRRFTASDSLGKKIGYGFHILKQMHHIAKARVVVLDTYCIPVSLFNHRGNLLVMQIWHSIGCMKKFGYAMVGKEEGSSREMADLMHMHRGYDYMTISSMDFLKDFLEGFDTIPEKVVEIPLPKASLLSDRKYAEEKRKEFFDAYPEASKKKNILYCPTFRKDGGVSQNAIKALFDCIDKDKYNLLYKPHPIEDAGILPSGIILSDLPTWEVIFAADYVISDYSSVIYEAGLAGKPIFAYAYDWEEYSTKREINFDIKNEFPGLFTADPQKIITAIENGDYDMDVQKAFTDRNVVMPKDMTCAQAHSKFIVSHLK